MKQRQKDTDCVLLSQNYFYDICMKNAVGDYNGDDQDNWTFVPSHIVWLIFAYVI